MKRRIKWRWQILGLVVLLTAVWLLLVNLWSPTRKLRFHMDVRYSVEDPQFLATVSAAFGPELVPNNEIQALNNGNEIFPAMLAAIAQAQKSINLETFIYWSGQVGSEFTAALSERARHGVKVNVLLDWIGSRHFNSRLLHELKKAGAHVEFYHPVRWYDLDRLNNRTHRHIVVVDGRVGFIGGVGLADDWLGNGLDPKHWRDTHYRVTGPVVAQLQSAFLDNWVRTQNEVPQGEDYFPIEKPPAVTDGELAQVFKSSADEGTTSARLFFLYSILAARRSIDIENAYFLPDRQFIDELTAAVHRGVRVRVLVPSKTDSRVVLKASHASWDRLLRGGVEIWTYTPAMLHTKLMVVDGVWTSVGSANFDPRSFRLNKEANLNVWGHRFGASATAQFERDLAVSARVQRSDWESRPLLERITDFLMLALGPQL